MLTTSDLCDKQTTKMKPSVKVKIAQMYMHITNVWSYFWILFMHVTACEESEDTAFGLLSGTYTNTEAVSTCCESTAHL